MPYNKTDVIIIGGSLSGLMNAIVQRNLGYRVHVIERSSPEALQSEAAEIRAGPEAHAFIETYVNNYGKYAHTVPMVEVMNKDAEVVEKSPPSAPLRFTTWKILYDMFMRTLMVESTNKPPARYDTRHEFGDMRAMTTCIAIMYQNLDDGSVTTEHANFIIAADGANSSVRSFVSPGLRPKYAGYVTWRGRIPENDVSAETREALRDRCAVLRMEPGYLVSYHVPSDTEQGRTHDRDFVFIWYDMIQEDSPIFAKTFTDIDGKRHSATIPRGKMHLDGWRRILNRKSEVGNPYFVELIEKLEQPFVSAVRDLDGSKPVFERKRLVLVGDALAQCRPHASGSTSQASMQAMELGKVREGKLPFEEWEKNFIEGVANAQTYSLAMAEYLFTGKPPDATKPTVGQDSLQNSESKAIV